MSEKSKTHRLKQFIKRGSLALVALAAVLLIARVFFFSGPYLPPQQIAESRIVDLHCHAAGTGAGGSGCFVSPTLRNSYKFDIYLKSFGVSREDLAEHGDVFLLDKLESWVAASEHVDETVVLALDGVIDDEGELDLTRTEVYVPNEYIGTEVATRPHLRFGASINPNRHDAIQLLEWSAEQGAVLVKWIPSIQMIDPSDENLRPFYERMKALGIPLLTHTGQERSFTSARDELADPLRLELPLEIGVTVIAAHIASTGSNEGERDTDRLVRLMKRYPNLYSEISSLTQVNKLGYLEEALTNEVFKDRLLYGTDFPLINTAIVSPWFYPLQLTRQQMTEISAIENPWDRDVELKRALGVPAEIFTATAKVLSVGKPAN